MAQQSLPACNLCGRTFRSTSRKDDHERKHTALKYECDDCGWKFREYANFQEHIDGCVVAKTVERYRSFHDEDNRNLLKIPNDTTDDNPIEIGDNEELEKPNLERSDSSSNSNTTKDTTHVNVAQQKQQKTAKDKRPKAFASAVAVVKPPPEVSLGTSRAYSSDGREGRRQDKPSTESPHNHSRDKTEARKQRSDLKNPTDRRYLFDVFEERAKNLQNSVIQTVNKSFQCDICSKKFIQRSNLNEHKESAHRQELEGTNQSDAKQKSRSKERADKEGQERKKVDKHIPKQAKDKHQKSGRKGKNQCEYCRRGFNSSQKFAMHIVDHEEDALVFECPGCESMFKIWFELYQHAFHCHKMKIQKKEEHLFFIKSQSKHSTDISNAKKGAQMVKDVHSTDQDKGTLGFSFLPNGSDEANTTFCLPDDVFSATTGKKPRSAPEEKNRPEKKAKDPHRRWRGEYASSLTDSTSTASSDASQKSFWRVHIATPPSSPGTPQKTDFCAFCHHEYGEKDDPWLDEPWEECLGCKLYCHNICMEYHAKECSGTASDLEVTRSTSSASTTSSSTQLNKSGANGSKKGGPKRALYNEEIQERRSTSPEAFILAKPIEAKSRSSTSPPSHTVTTASSVVTSTPMRTPARVAPESGSKRRQDGYPPAAPSPLAGMIPTLRISRLPDSTLRSSTFTVTGPPCVSPVKRRRVDTEDVEEVQPHGIKNADEHCCYLALADGFKNLRAQGRLIAKQEVLRVLCNVAYDMMTPSMLMPNIDPAPPAEQQRKENDAVKDAETFCEKDIFPHLRKLDRQRRKLAVLKIQHALYNVQVEFSFRVGNQ